MIGTTTIGKLAKTWGMARNTLWRRLMVLHRDHPEGGWLVRRSSTWSVNVTMLRKFHPELFQQPSTKDFSIRLLSLESTVKQVRGRVAGLERAFQSVPKCSTTA